MNHRRIFALASLITLFFIADSRLATSWASSRHYNSFPGGPKNVHLALTAQGSYVKMTYTGATYEIVKGRSGPIIELQIKDALLQERPGSEDINRSGPAGMKLVFDPDSIATARLPDGQAAPSGGQAKPWKVSCIQNNAEVTVADPSQRELLLQGDLCRIDRSPDRWSDSFFIDMGENKTLFMKTVWDDSTRVERNYGTTKHTDLINVFKFRTYHAKIRLAATKEQDIKESPSQSAYHYKTVREKSRYAHSLNWAVLYNSSSDAEFSFELDAQKKDALILFDKDADAARLYGPTIPEDTGISMHVTWTDGSPIPPGPEWTRFDQTRRDGFEGEGFVPGETNSYQGPSGDTGNDEAGVTSIQWYKIGVKNHVTKKVRITWKGFSVRNNAYGLASTSDIEASCPEDFPCPDEEEKENKDCKDCDENKDEDEEIDEERIDGEQDMTVKRCFAYNYFGGRFECSTTCDAIEPATKITVRDTLTNKSKKTVFNYRYFPLPLSSAFIYEANSIRIDDPEVGISVKSDGETFPPAGGVVISGSIQPKRSRTVYFSYNVPDDILKKDLDTSGDSPKQDGGQTQCFPEEGELFSKPPEGQSYPKIEYETKCSKRSSNSNSSSSTSSDADEEVNGIICVKAGEGPKLNATLSAIPSEKNPVYQGTIITYHIIISNASRQPVTQLNIEGVVPKETTCNSGNCQSVTLANPKELQELGTFEYFYSVKVNADARGTTIVHPPRRIRFQGEDGESLEVETNALEHELIAESEPIGDFQHDITLSRRIVLNAVKRDRPRKDEGDRSTVTHVFRYTGTGKSVAPSLTSGASAPHSTTRNFCNEVGYYGPSSSYDAPFASQILNYQTEATQKKQRLNSYSDIRSEDILFTVTTDLPKKRPELINISGRGTQHQDIILYRIAARTIVSRGINAVNYFMKYGGEIEASPFQEDGILKNENLIISSAVMPKTETHAVTDGQNGEIKTNNKAMITEDLWQYQQVGPRSPIQCSRPCGRTSTCYRTVYPPEYQWAMILSRPIVLEDNDRDFITVLTSVAWLQTHFGHMNIGEPFWFSDPKSGDPNLVDLADKSIPSAMKFYSPPDEYNADLFVYTPDDQHPLRSRLEEEGKMSNSGFEQGFVPQLSRGEAYDRKLFPRDYFDDLINREVYGGVIRLNKNGSPFFMKGTVELDSDTIYYIKGSLTIGEKGKSEVILDGGKSRIVVEGNAFIKSNIRYSRSAATDLKDIPSIRLHTTGSIFIDPSVTDIELMMLAENEFHSGRSDQQLRILGDVIAYKAFWERSPLNEDRADEEMVNKPSEIIYEDFRKYFLTPPGDKKLPDIGHVWREVAPATGVPILKNLYSPLPEH